MSAGDKTSNVTGDPPAAGDAESSAPTPSAPVWQQTLDRLKELPARDPAWDGEEIEAFIGKVTALLKEKTEERKFVVGIQRRIERLNAHPYRPSEDPLPSSDGVGVSYLLKAHELTERLLTSLDEYADVFIRAQSQPAPRLMAELTSRFPQCLELWTAVAAFLKDPLTATIPVAEAPTTAAPPVTPPPDAPVPIEPPDVEAERDAPVDIRLPEIEPKAAAIEALPVAPIELPTARPSPAPPPIPPRTEPREPIVEEVKPPQPVGVPPPEVEPEPPAPVAKAATVESAWPGSLADAAQRVTERPADLPARRALLEWLLADGQWSEAYWLAYGVASDPAIEGELQTFASRIESLLNCVFAVLSFPLSRDDGAVLNKVQPVETPYERALAFVIALTGMPGNLPRQLRPWLAHRPKDARGLESLSDYIGSLRVPVPLSPDDVATCREAEKREREIAELRETLERWKDEPPRHSDWNVWTKLVAQGAKPLWHVVNRTLTHGANPPPDLRREVEGLTEENKAKRLIHEHDESRGKMNASMLRNVCGEITEIAGHCLRYFELMAAHQTIDVTTAALAEFRTSVRKLNADVVADLQRCIETADDHTVRAAWQAGLHVWRWFAAYLDIDADSAPPLLRPAYLIRNAPLALYPIDRDDAGEIQPAQLADSTYLAKVFARQVASTALTAREEAIAQIVARADYRFIDELRFVVGDADANDALVAELEEKLAESREEIRRGISRMEVAVSRARALGFIDEVEQANADSILVEARRQYTATGYLKPAMEAVQLLEAEFGRKESAWVASLEDDIATVARRLRARGVGGASVAKLDQAVATAKRFTDASELSAALSDLLESARAAEKFENAADAENVLAGIGDSRTTVDHLRSFLSWMESGSKPAADSSESWAKTWQQLGSSSDTNDRIRWKTARQALRAIGFEISGGDDPDSGASALCRVVSVEKKPTTSPIPQFGSGLSKIKVAIDRSGDGDLSSVLKMLARIGDPGLPSIVLRSGPIPSDQRFIRQLAAVAAPLEARTPTIVIDRNLWMFLERVPATQRLAVMLHCTLPFTYCNPFRSFGYVPRELFVGRQQEIASIADGRSRLLFGGRQFGKSAILQAVQRQVDGGPTSNVRCLMLDLRHKFRMQSPENIWADIRRAFADNINPKLTGTASKNATVEAIKKWLGEDSSRRLLILADEADSFLWADTRNHFQETSFIAALMRETADRFRLVLAGTLDVARHAMTANAPFNEFGEIVTVLPILPADARRMLQAPLACLGIVLNDADVYQILARTNYYPGLIQLLCERLVDLRADSVKTVKELLRPIPSDTIARLVQEESVRKAMVHRFALTLGLSDDYKGIIYCLVRRELTAGLKAEPISAKAAHLEVQQVWRTRFGNMPLGEFVVILDELVSMGVLVKNAAGYRFRSPNLIPLLGSSESLRAELESLEQQALDNNQDFHNLYDKEQARFSPLSQRQDATLVTGGTRRASLVITPSAGEWEAIVASIRSAQSDEFDEIVTMSADAALDAKPWADRDPKDGRARLTIAVNLADLDPLRIGDVMRGLQPGSQLSRFRRVTSIFGLPGESAIRYFCLPPDLRAETEATAARVSVRRWTTNEVRVALNDLDLSSVMEDVHRVTEATGGWHFLLTRLFEGWQRQRSARENVDAFVAQYESIRPDFLASLCLATPGHRDTVAVLHVVEPEWKTFHLSALEEYGLLIADSYAVPDDAVGLIEYLREIGALFVADDKLRVEPLLARFCEARP